MSDLMKPERFGRKSQPLWCVLSYTVIGKTTMTEETTTTKVRDSLINMFLDNTEGEVYAQGRLKTVRNGDTLSLIAYHREKIAEYDEPTGTVTVFAGHHGNVSQTVNRYISRVVKIAGRRNDRQVILTELSPNVRMRPVATAARNIGQYVRFGGELSPAEKREVREVNKALKAEL